MSDDATMPVTRRTAIAGMASAFGLSVDGVDTAAAQSSSEPRIQLGDTVELDDNANGEPVLRHTPSGAELVYDSSTGRWTVGDFEATTVHAEDAEITRFGQAADYVIRKVDSSTYLATNQHNKAIEEGDLSTVLQTAISDAATHAHFHFSGGGEATTGTFELDQPVEWDGFDNLKISGAGRNNTRVTPSTSWDGQSKGYFWRIGQSTDSVTILTVEDIKLADNAGDADVGVECYANEQTWRSVEFRGFANWGFKALTDGGAMSWTSFIDVWAVDPNGSAMLFDGPNRATRIIFNGCHIEGPRDSTASGKGLEIASSAYSESVVMDGCIFKRKDPITVTAARSVTISDSDFRFVDGDYCIQLGGNGDTVRDVNIEGNNFDAPTVDTAIVALRDGVTGDNQFASTNKIRTDGNQAAIFDLGSAVSSTDLNQRLPPGHTDIEHDSGVVNPEQQWNRVADPSGSNFTITEMPAGTYGQEVTIAHPQDGTTMTISHDSASNAEPFVMDDGTDASLTSFDNAIRFVFTNNGWEEVWRNF